MKLTQSGERIVIIHVEIKEVCEEYHILDKDSQDYLIDIVYNTGNRWVANSTGIGFDSPAKAIGDVLGRVFESRE